MKNVSHVPSPIRLCLQDSIFRNRNTDFSSFFKLQQQKYHENAEPISSYFPTQKQQPKLIEYINAQYYGKVKNNEPYGTGIVIDDQMNFFMSTWDKFKLNKLTFIKLLNQTTIFGTWINGRIQGWNCFCMKHLKIYLQIKYRDNFGRQEKIFSLGLAIDQLNNLCYLLQVSIFHQKFSQLNHQIRLQIINRLQIPFAIRKEYHQNINILTRLLFAQNVQCKLKIPYFLSSLQTFMDHFSQNNDDVVFKKVPSQNQLMFFLSVQNSHFQEEIQPKFIQFNPYKNLIRQDKNDQQLKSSDKVLGIVLDQKNSITKSIGVFDSKNQLNGIGLTVAYDSTKLFGHFKSNLLTKQFNNPEPTMRHTQSFKKQSLKAKLKQHHMKSLNFVHDIFYIEEIESTIKITNQISEYIQTFENQYKKRYGKAIDSFSASQQSFDMKYQIQPVPSIQVFKRKQNELNQNIQRRPFGKIVNSRSPLRSLKKSHSKSPSDAQTFRQRRPLDFHYADHPQEVSRSQSKNGKNLTIQTPSAFNSRYNQETSKNRQYTDSNKNLSMNYKDIIQRKMRQVQEKDIMQTTRRQTERIQNFGHQRQSYERRMQDLERERSSKQRRMEGNMGYKCRYDRVQKRRQQFWK